jgi:mono/diheme cytochrome c family protein
MHVRHWSLAAALAVGAAAAWVAAAPSPAPPPSEFDAQIDAHSRRLLSEGRKIFRFDTFGSEAFWGDALHLHQAIAGQANGGVGAGISPQAALKLGLKVDATALPAAVVTGIKNGTVKLDDPATTLELLKLDAVVGVKGVFDAQKKRLTSMGIQCALCHSTVDDSFAPGIGRRLDGWPNRDLDVGAIVASAPTVKPFADLLGVDEAAVRTVLKSWGPGKYDAELSQDGKHTRPDGKSGATLLPAAFGLAGINLHTYTGWGSVPYWNAYVANTQMHGQGTFFDPRLDDKDRFPVAAKSGSHNQRGKPDLVTGKLAALHYYQISIPAPKPKAGSFDAAAAKRGKGIFEGKAQCATCHVPPLFTEPGWAMHSPEEMGIDDFQASRSPDRKYRTTPLAGLFTRMKGGFYHDGRFADLKAVVAHYNGKRSLGLSDAETADLVEYLKSL